MHFPYQDHSSAFGQAPANENADASAKTNQSPSNPAAFATNTEPRGATNNTTIKEADHATLAEQLTQRITGRSVTLLEMLSRNQPFANS